MENSVDFRIQIGADLQVSVQKDIQIPMAYFISPIGPTHGADCPYFTTLIYYRSKFSRSILVSKTVAVRNDELPKIKQAHEKLYNTTKIAQCLP